MLQGHAILKQILVTGDNIFIFTQDGNFRKLSMYFVLVVVCFMFKALQKGLLVGVFAECDYVM